MKRKYLLGLLIALLVFLFVWLRSPTDILKDYPDHTILDPQGRIGQQMILDMEEAYGGREVWEQWSEGHFIQYANWYGRLRMSGWDTIPQLYSLNLSIGSNDCKIELLGGPRKGKQYQLVGDQLFEFDSLENKFPSTEEHFKDKMIFKNYWFQFPFRIGEAEILHFWGERKIEGKTYNLVYASWGSINANREYDQFMLYLDQETNLIELLHFTVRDKFPAGELTGRFQDFREAQGLQLPYSQYILLGSPDNPRLNMHENHYEFIEFKNH